MNLIQPLLISLLIASALIYQRRMRSKVGDRMIAIFLAGIGAVLVASPDLSTKAAHLLGVGRGADLVFYISLIGIGFLMMVLFSKVRALEAQITSLAREIAISQAETKHQL